MSDQQSDLIRKNTGGNEPEQSQQKLNLNDENPTNASEVKTITNICYDVLELIFDRLDLENLLMVADTCKRLRIAAIAYFCDLVNNGRIWDSFEITCGTQNHIMAGITTTDGHIQVSGLKLNLKFLRCFGAKPTKMNLNYNANGNGKDNEYVQRYIDQYCCDALTNITIDFNQTILKNLSQNPFKNVTYLSLENFNAGKNELANYVSRFPKLCKLAMYHFDMNVNIDVTGDMAFPQVERLEICFLRSKYQWELVRILSANRQLKYLHLLDITIELTKLLNIIDGYQSITTIKFSNEYNLYDGTEKELIRFANEHPTIANLIIENYIFKADAAIKFIHQAKSLKKFAFRVCGQSECDHVLAQLSNNEWEHNDPEIDVADCFAIILKRCNVD